MNNKLNKHNINPQWTDNMLYVKHATQHKAHNSNYDEVWTEDLAEVTEVSNL